MVEQTNKRRPPANLAGGRFTVHKKLGAGCFGEVYLGTNAETGEDVAVKTEDLHRRSFQQLAHEAEILSILHQPEPVQGFAQCYFYGRECYHHCMVMDLLGLSIEDRVRKCGGQFTPKTTALIASQVLYRIEYLHSKGLVHRDIKPENFMFGAGNKIHHVYLIDFGLSQKYWDKRHVSMKQKLSLTGTARYASINAHRGYEQSRRDDLEAIGHMFMYFLRGKLPWSGLEARTAEEKYRKIMEKKESVQLSDLCNGFPDEFQVFLRHARRLEFTQHPDYEMAQRLFLGLASKEGAKHDYEFEWFDGKKEVLQPEMLVPLKWERAAQPDSPPTLPQCRSRGAPAEVRRSKRLFCLCGKSE